MSRDAYRLREKVAQALAGPTAYQDDQLPYRQPSLTGNENYLSHNNVGNYDWSAKNPGGDRYGGAGSGPQDQRDYPAMPQQEGSQYQADDPESTKRLPISDWGDAGAGDICPHCGKMR